jgi:chromate reductase, NAD(P)H dehydrogenase (quinone)
VIGASPGAFGAVWAQAELKKVLGLIGVRVLPIELPVAKAAKVFADDGRLMDDELRVRLGEVVNHLATAAQEREAIQATA